MSAKLNLIHCITELNDEIMLIDPDTVKKQSKWVDLSDDEKVSIEKGLSDVRENRTVPHSEVRKRYEKWLV